MSGENTKEKKALDSILDEALDELDIESDDEDVKNIIQSPRIKTEVSDKYNRNNTQNDSETDLLDASLQDLVKNLSQMSTNMTDTEGAPDVAALEKLISELQSPQNTDTSKDRNTTEPNKAKKKDANQKNSSEADIDEKVEKIINDMSNMDSGMPQMEQMGNEMMESMMKEFENMGNKEDSEEIVEGMMKQLISKEIMYEPIKQVTDKFPHWLARKKNSLSDEEYNRYGNQYQYFQRIVHLYENDPDNFPRLMELLQDVQEYGQPPADIIKELAPDLDLDEDGMPKMDMGNNLPAMFPGNNECPMM